MEPFFNKLQIGKRIDRTLTGKLGTQIAFLTIAFCVLLLLGTGLAFWLKASGTDPSMVEGKPHGLFWWVFLHAVNPGNIGMETNAPVIVRWFAGIITLFGWVLLGGILITLLTNTYWTRLNNARQGKNRYRFFGHIIIFGWDEMIITLINELCSTKADQEIVILSPQDAVELRSKIYSNLQDSHEKNVYVLNGEFAEEEIKSLYVGTAEKVYIFGERDIIGSSIKNLEIAFTISKIIAPNREKSLPCYVHLPTPSSFDMIKGVDFIQEPAKSVDIRLFNFHEDWARRIWSQSLTDKKYRYSSTQIGNIDITIHKHVHFVIIGFGKMGQALTRYAVRMAHFKTAENTQITVIDHKIGDKKDQFYAQTPGIRNVTGADKVTDINEIEFIEQNVFSDETKGKLSAWANESGKKLHIMICISDPDQALSMGMTLPQEIKQKDIPVLIRQARFNENTFWDQQSGKKRSEGANNWKHLYFFGWRNEFYDWSTHEKLACAMHESYREVSEKDGWLDESKPQYKKWDDLPECFRWSNRYRTDMITVKWRRIGRNDSDLLSDDLKNEFTEDEIELLARMEHDRWCAERFIDGWVYGPERDDKAKVHPDLIAFDDLTDQQKKYDLNTLNDIKQLLKKAEI